MRPPPTTPTPHVASADHSNPPAAPEATPHPQHPRAGESTAATPSPPHLNRVQRRLVTAVITGSVLIAGIGFAGSYTAVKELALDKGFGTFSYLFPIGIDAGICVTLALDLLLTWTHIPFPLLRHTAWLLTSATIAFNAAAAWPDPLAVAMHAATPLLFIVTVEAARHAIGRIAHITHATHLEPIRHTRWLLAPLPTFRLWRRMKLWEIRTYHQAIHLEQQRLIYQARLRTRYGRRWRRRAPIETLIPLKLARYGVPIQRTAPSDSAAANLGTKAPRQPISPTPNKPPTSASPRNPPHITTAATEAVTAALNTTQPPLMPLTAEPVQGPHEAHASAQEGDDDKFTKTPAKATASSSDRSNDADKNTAKGGQDSVRKPTKLTSQEYSPHGKNSYHAPHTQLFDRFQSARRGETSKPSGNRPHHPVEGPSAQPHNAVGHRTDLSKVDRYYLAWITYRKEHGREPTGQQLSAYLAAHGVHGRDGNPISPATLRRYFLSYRIYNVWAEHRVHTPQPSPDDIIRECTTRGITAQYNAPITTHHIATNIKTFERRWRKIRHQNPTKDADTTEHSANSERT
ncbi:DUF2637 domain-containing protein [Streptomyces sp. NPDC029554]|uniref:DUF2637 domain-containing protein n=1 Tax=Streptomyces sp. NPDC029554 TaxID=3155126 RepID=UPI0034027986